MPLHPEVLAARDLLVAHREDYRAAVEEFTWPALEQFNFATDWFDGLAENHPDTTALRIVSGPDLSGDQRTFGELAAESRQAANFLTAHGVRRGDRILLVLGNVVELWQLMLGAIRVGAAIIPAAPQLAPADLADRVKRGKTRMVVAGPTDTTKFDHVDGGFARVVVGGDAEGWTRFDLTGLPAEYTPEGVSAADDPLLLYFTSGTTAKPKLVEHTMVSYPVGHLSTMYWMGVGPGDIHLNISSPGWGKHAWSNFFGPWLAGATVMVFNYSRFVAADLLQVLERAKVTTFCAPPTVWRMLVQAHLESAQVCLRECLSAGEPLNPDVIDRVRRAWGVTIRDGYGQTETTCSVGNSPGQPVTDGAMGRPMPGYPLLLVDPKTGAEVETEGELCIRLDPAKPLPLMAAYRDDADTTDTEMMTAATRDGVYHTGDVVRRDADGLITYVGRADDVFKASDYRISPFELESVLIEHEAVAEAAVVPAPDPLRLAVPKAFIQLIEGHLPNAETAHSILAYARENLAPFQRIRRLEFAELPKTISGKIRRVELRERLERQERTEYRDTDFDLRGRSGNDPT